MFTQHFLENPMLLLGTVVSWLAIIFGALRVGLGFFVASGADAATRAEMAARYLGSATSGQAIDAGVMTFVFGVTLGVLVKIGRSLNR
ncbi:MAG: hypothetical protein KIS86_04725 [Devosia sp.]|nr:hypothetical protein [Devosia sp.]